MRKPWKKLAETKLLEHKRLTVYEDIVELPNGTRTDYLRFGKDTDGATVIAVNGEDEILVQKEYSYPPNEWLYQFPGGGLKVGESIEAGALRELAEEAGVKGSLRRIGEYYPDNRRRQEKMHVFIATDLAQASASPDPEEVFETYWFPPAQIDQLIASGQITNYSMLAAWALYRSAP